jgi:hypothetical protein
MQTLNDGQKMKYFIYIILVLLISSCNNRTKTINDSSSSERLNTDSLLADSILTFSFDTNFRSLNISNKSNRQIDLLFNGIDNYFGGHRNPKINFRTECLPCEPLYEYMGGLFFTKRLLIKPNQIKFYKTDINIPDSVNRIKLRTYNRERTNPKFSFSEGEASIKYIGVSCNDADFNNVYLSYPSGEIAIDSLINASFFEYDLDKDGQIEQYLLGSRNCSQEFALIRIRKSDQKK